MAARKVSAHTQRRHVRAAITKLDAARAAVARTKPRSAGKKGWRTRRLNELDRKLRSARGQLTKALNRIAREARTRKSGTSAARQKRSDAAKRGWATRRARKASASAAQVQIPSSKLAIPFLTVEKGVVGVWPPSKDDRSKVGKYWGQVFRLLDNQPASFDQFEGDSIFDEISGKRLPFVTDLNVIYAHYDEYLFGLTFYRNRHEFERFA